MEEMHKEKKLLKILKKIESIKEESFIFRNRISDLYNLFDIHIQEPSKNLNPTSDQPLSHDGFVSRCENELDIIDGNFNEIKRYFEMFNNII